MAELDRAWQAGDWPTASAMLDTLQSRDPGAVDFTDKRYVAEYSWGKSLLEKGDKAGAATHFVRAAQIDDSRSEAKDELLALTPTPVPTATPKPTLVPTAAPTPTQAPGLNVALTTGDYGLLVPEVRFLSSVGSFSRPSAGSEYALVSVVIKNLGGKNEQFNQFNFKLQNGQGVIRGPTFVAELDNQLNSGELAPGAFVGGWVPFEVRKGDRNLTLIYSPCLIFCSDLKVPLK